MNVTLLPAAFLALFGVLCDAYVAISSEGTDFRGAVLLQNLASSVGSERLKSGASFADPRQAVIWNNRTYSFVSSTNLPDLRNSHCRARVPNDFLLFVPERPKEVAWSCPPSQACCGLQCCDIKQRSKREWWHYERSDRRKEFGYVIAVVVIAVIVTLYLCFRSAANNDPRKRIIKERRERMAKRRHLQPHYKAAHAQQTHVQIEQVQQLDPPLPLSTALGHEHFEPS